MPRVRSPGDALFGRATHLAGKSLGSLFALFFSVGVLASKATGANPSPETNPFAPTLTQVQGRFGRIQQEVDRLRTAGQAADAERLAQALQHFRDQLGGTAPSQVAGSELDVVGVYNPGTVTVNVGPTDRPVVLALSSYEDVQWRLNLQPGANLQKVIASSRDAPTRPPGLPDDVPFEIAPQSFLVYGKDYTHFHPAARTLNALTGLPVTTLQGQYDPGPGGATFTVGDAGAEWAAQRVLSEMVPLYREATAFQLAQDRAAAAAYRFRARYNPYGGLFSSGGSVAEFSPLGPIDGTFVIPPPQIKHVAFDPATSTYYAVASLGLPVRLETTGAATELPASPYVINRSSGLTFDTTRNRLVLSTHGGEGFLLSYSPEESRWSMLASLDWIRIHSLTYFAPDDAFYALMGEANEPVSLVRYDAEGRQVRSIGLSQYIPGVSVFDLQLTATGDRLSLLTPALPDLYDPLAPPQVRSYLIDPHTGVTTYLGTISIVPEPAAAALLLLCGVGPCSRGARHRRMKDER